jgi:hypothetical protein
MAFNKIFRLSQWSWAIVLLVFFISSPFLRHFLVFHFVNVTVPSQRDFVTFTLQYVVDRLACSYSPAFYLFYGSMFVPFKYRMLCFLSCSLSKFVLLRSVWVKFKFYVVFLI